MTMRERLAFAMLAILLGVGLFALAQWGFALLMTDVLHPGSSLMRWMASHPDAQRLLPTLLSTLGTLLAVFGALRYQRQQQDRQTDNDPA